jgi:hypothetical protein
MSPSVWAQLGRATQASTASHSQVSDDSWESGCGETANLKERRDERLAGHGLGVAMAMSIVCRC